MRLIYTFILVNLLFHHVYSQIVPARPLGIYVTWGAHDQLSDNVKLTDDIINKELDQYLTLRNYGTTLDYFLIDMYWFDSANGAYAAFDPQNFTSGIDPILDKCKQNNVTLGLWISPNVLGWNDKVKWIQYQDKWADAASKNKLQMAMYTGSYLPEVIKNMQMWYDKGIRLMKLDFVALWAAKAGDETKYTELQIRKMNEDALYAALTAFRKKNPEVVMIGYNGFDTGTKPAWPDWVSEKEIKTSVNPKWLDVLHAMFCGDPAFGRIPTSSMWRSMDYYSDQMLREFHFNKIPLRRIDHSSFFITNTGTGYWRKTSAWKAMLVLALSRGSYFNTYYGNLELLSDTDKQWFAHAQSLYFEALQSGNTSVWGAFPSENQPFGYITKTGIGELFTVCNPSQSFKKITLPVNTLKYKILFADKGYVPAVENGQLSLGPEQMAVIGLNEYAQDKFVLGVEEDIIIPKYINPLAANFTRTAKNTYAGEVKCTAKSDIRVVIEFTDSLGKAVNIKSLKDMTPMSDNIIITAKTLTKNIPVQIKHNKIIWSGLNFVCVELKNTDLSGVETFKLECKINHYNKYFIKPSVYEVKY
ncbi:MAG: hypothetical protein NW207_09800 [Cytophagales bacterium]|nr:hypothetical protein [Cytophagales bacterium]